MDRAREVGAVSARASSWRRSPRAGALRGMETPLFDQARLQALCEGEIARLNGDPFAVCSAHPGEVELVDKIGLRGLVDHHQSRGAEADRLGAIRTLLRGSSTKWSFSS